MGGLSWCLRLLYLHLSNLLSMFDPLLAIVRSVPKHYPGHCFPGLQTYTCRLKHFTLNLWWWQEPSQVIAWIFVNTPLGIALLGHNVHNHYKSDVLKDCGDASSGQFYSIEELWQLQHCISPARHPSESFLLLPPTKETPNRRKRFEKNPTWCFKGLAESFLL